MIWTIAKREFLTRVTKRSFIVMTVLGPLIMAALLVVPVWFSGQTVDSAQKYYIIDATGLEVEHSVFNEYPKISYLTINRKDSLHSLLDMLTGTVIYLDQDSLSSQVNPTVYFSGGKKEEIQMVLDIWKGHTGNIEACQSPGLLQEPFYTLRESSMEQANNTVNAGIAYLLVVLLYFFIFLYGMQVMKGVIEEKVNRIIEVMITIVKPFHLMMGKILGLSLLGFLQYLIWIVASAGLFFWLTGSWEMDNLSPGNMDQYVNNGMEASDVTSLSSLMDTVFSTKILIVLGVFALYFLLGYLIYSALFAAIGSLADVDTETQQFTFPVTLPLLFSFIMVQQVIADPNSSLAFWMSMIPFTSPVIMVARLPFFETIPGFWWQLSLSLGFLLFGFLGVTALAAYIYRKGILLYGKKITLKDIFTFFNQ